MRCLKSCWRSEGVLVNAKFLTDLTFPLESQIQTDLSVSVLPWRRRPLLRLSPVMSILLVTSTNSNVTFAIKNLAMSSNQLVLKPYASAIYQLRSLARTSTTILQQRITRRSSKQELQVTLSSTRTSWQQHNSYHPVATSKSQRCPSTLPLGFTQENWIWDFPRTLKTELQRPWSRQPKTGVPTSREFRAQTNPVYPVSVELSSKVPSICSFESRRSRRCRILKRLYKRSEKEWFSVW